MSISLSTLRGHILTMKMKWISALTAKLVRWRCNSVELNLLLCFHSHMHWHTWLQTHTVTCLLTHLHMCTHTHTHTLMHQQTLLIGLLESSCQARRGIQTLVGSASMKRREKRQDWAGIELAVALTQPTLQAQQTASWDSSPSGSSCTSLTPSHSFRVHRWGRALHTGASSLEEEYGGTYWTVSWCHRDNRQIIGSDRYKIKR